jgi:membrane associated rhomboid family serine protease
LDAAGVGKGGPVLPIGDELQGRVRTPYVTYTLIAINVVIFFVEFLLPEAALQDFITRWGAIPAQISQGQDLYGLISSMFLHGGWLHIISNMLFLFVFGDNVEDAMGHVRYLIFYFLCGIVAGLAQVLINPASTIPLIGASGAISGVLGAYIVLFPHGRIRSLVFLGYFVTVIMVPAWAQIGLWIVLQFINGILSLGARMGETGGVAFWAHVGGFVAGAVLVFLFRDRSAVDRQRAARTGGRAWERVTLRSR